ncbi:MAG: hypothetical protein ACYCOU_03020 [Sulfobacillus sp.]
MTTIYLPQTSLSFSLQNETIVATYRFKDGDKITDFQMPETWVSFRDICTDGKPVSVDIAGHVQRLTSGQRAQPLTMTRQIRLQRATTTKPNYRQLARLELGNSKLFLKADMVTGASSLTVEPRNKETPANEICFSFPDFQVVSRQGNSTPLFLRASQNARRIRDYKQESCD